MLIKNVQFLRKTTLLVAMIVSAARIVSANTVAYTYTGETGGGVDIGINTGDWSGTADVGQLVMTTSNPNFSSTLLSYCTDVGVFLANTYNYTPTPLSSATGVAPVWISGGIQNAATLWYNDKATAATATQTAGLQLAIWELLYNNVASSYSTSIFSSHSNKGFYLTTSDAGTLAAETYAVSILNNFKNLPPEQNVEWLAPTESNGAIGGSQGLLYQTPSVPDASSTLALLGFAVTALGVTRKLRGSKA
jgi:hypothetical protein